ncbi:MAG TPA: uracil-DNA glycosylase family protein, partial [Elusimicrobiota bacterium]|nr:uracil-DNA glycosylase family protein [Elusimicrobiota bacterium]
IAKCRPPRNRPPKPEESLACRPFLEKQIALLRPTRLVLLGATALKNLVPTRTKIPMKKAAGRLFPVPALGNAEAVVFYHPAAALYNRKLERVMRRHARQTLKGARGTA